MSTVGLRAILIFSFELYSKAGLLVALQEWKPSGRNATKPHPMIYPPEIFSLSTDHSKEA